MFDERVADKDALPGASLFNVHPIAEMKPPPSAASVGCVASLFWVVVLQ